MRKRPRPDAPPLTLTEAVVAAAAPELLPEDDRYRAAFQRALDGIVLINDTGFYVDVNESLCRLLGAQREELIGKHFSELVPQGMLPQAVSGFEQFREAGARTSEFPLQAADGTIVDLEWMSRANIVPGLHMCVARDITERNHARARLAAEHAVTRILADSQTLNDAAPQVLAAIRDSLRADIGLMWLPDSAYIRLEVTVCCPRQGSKKAARFGEECRKVTFARGEGLPGRVWGTLSPAWIEEISEDPAVRRAQIASKAGLKSALSFPIASGEKFYGVMEFLAAFRAKPDQALLSMAGAIGTEIAHFIARRKAEEEVLRLNARLRRSVRETNHRVRNNLQIIAAMIDLIKLSGREMVPISQLAHIGEQIRSLSVLHELMTAQNGESAVEDIPIEEALERLLPILQVFVGDRRVIAHTDKFNVPLRTAAALVILINEIVTNAARHGGGDINVYVESIEGQGRLRVLDDGSGFPRGFDPAAAAGTGFDLIESVGKWDLRGEVSYSNHAGGGAEVTVTFPIPAASGE